MKNIMKPKGSPRNTVLRGSSSHGASVLSADVDLVATGIALDAGTEDLKGYLQGKGLETVKIECLPRQEVIESSAVRSKTMKVTIKATDLEKAKSPEIWPMRVGIRHFRAPPRPQNVNEGWADQSSRVGGSFKNRDRRNQRNTREQERVNPSQEQLTLVSNMFGALANLNCP